MRSSIPFVTLSPIHTLFQGVSEKSILKLSNNCGKIEGNVGFFCCILPEVLALSSDHSQFLTLLASRP
jgi:hypothetical protein